MTAEEIPEFTEEALLASIARESFLDFCKAFIFVAIPGKVRWGFHMELICRELQEVAERIFLDLPLDHNLLFNLPPGTTKSTLVSVLFPAWLWTRMPEAQIIGVSYSNILALELSRKCRDVVKSDLYRACFPEIQIREDQDNKGFFVNTLGGRRYAAGSRGTVTGFHAHVLCFPYETLVKTDRGDIPMGDIVTRRLNVRVLGADHSTGRLTWQDIRKYETNPGKELCRVEFEDGTSLECTHDHPVFVSGVGYVHASELVEGQRVVSHSAMQELRGGIQGQDLQEVPEDLFHSLPGCLPSRHEEFAQQEEGSSLRLLQEKVSLSSKTHPQLQVRKSVLLSQVCRREEAQASYFPMRELQQGSYGMFRSASCEVLQLPLPQCILSWQKSPSLAGIGSDRLSGMSKDVRNQNRSAGSQSECLLFSAVCQLGTFSQDFGGEESQIHSRGIGQAIFGQVPKGIFVGSQEGRVSLLPLQTQGDNQGTRRTPHRLRQVKRLAGESGNAVSLVSRTDARFDFQSLDLGEKVVCRVVLSVRIPETVYNLNVSEEHNYFAEGILVHNCIDDPLDPMRALSEAELLSVNYWIKNTLSSRKVDKVVSAIVMVMQRVHSLDPSAEMAEAANTRHFCIPATTDYPIQPPELVNYYVDGLMDPVRLPRKYIDELLAPGGPGEAFVACQYGQQPFITGGGIFKVSRLRWGRPPEAFKRMVRAWDKAGTAQRGVNALLSRGPAYTVGTLMGVDADDRVWILNVKRARMDSHAREQLIVSTARIDRQQYGRAVVVAVEQEPGASGLEGAQATARRLAGFSVVLSPASGTKEVRANEFSVCVNGGNCFLPQSLRDGNRWVGWAKDWVDELVAWPQSAFLDQGDSAALGFNTLVKPRVRVGGLKSRLRQFHDGIGKD